LANDIKIMMRVDYVSSMAVPGMLVGKFFLESREKFKVAESQF
jgi:hypothetical protein